ncbi:MAG TPA: DNA replication/repair protein RecF [Rhodanobacteraceae bacterium]|nr:DNA replication/repair protein RecF [Rhodanobacteraceae bacterium]
MNIELLRATDLRCFEQVSFAPGPGVNWLLGPNGAGKTTLLEAAYLLSHGRSFRAGSRTAPCRQGAREYLVYAEIQREDRARIRLGLTRTDDRWMARRNGEDLASLTPLFEACPVVYFGPESQSLVQGPAEERRAYLDWSVFHVEHASLVLWKAWRKALRQRNTLLRKHAAAAEFLPWEHELGSLAERIHVLRRRCLTSLEPYIAEEAALLVPELGLVRIDYRPGWDEQVGLGAQLASTRDRDRERGFTRHGAHRADWMLAFERVARREHLSRGQAKATALVCTLALARWLKDNSGEYPLLCLDDFESELDTPHAALVIGWLAGKPIQCWLTSTKEAAHGRAAGSTRVFHVKHSGCEQIA